MRSGAHLHYVRVSTTVVMYTLQQFQAAVALAPRTQALSFFMQVKLLPRRKQRKMPWSWIIMLSRLSLVPECRLYGNFQCTVPYTAFRRYCTKRGKKVLWCDLSEISILFLTLFFFVTLICPYYQCILGSRHTRKFSSIYPQPFSEYKRGVWADNLHPTLPL